jgi:hypothetical protein
MLSGKMTEAGREEVAEVTPGAKRARDSPSALRLKLVWRLRVGSVRSLPEAKMRR